MMILPECGKRKVISLDLVQCHEPRVILGEDRQGPAGMCLACPYDKEAPPLPGAFQMAGNFAKALMTHVATGMKRASEEKTADRRKECLSNACGQLVVVNNQYRCADQGCGCYLEEKWAWEDQKCPRDYW